MSVECWSIAFRKRNGDSTILDDIKTPFIPIKNTLRYWAADPHLFEYNGKTWLFAELYDRVILRGVLGCCELTEKGPTKWQVISKRPYHMSYPSVYEYNGGIFMIPETNEANKITLWQPTQFPLKWEISEILHGDICCVDSTVMNIGGRELLITYQFLNDAQVVKVFDFTDNKINGDGIILDCDVSNSRPAGNVFCVKNKYIRPSQDGVGGYGSALNFNEITISKDGKYSEKLIKKIKADQISTTTNKNYVGIHTYNLTSKYEVIDLKNFESRLKYIPGIFLGYIPRRLIERKYK